MMNKKNLWFLTLFSLVLVLSVYYVTMPNDLLAASTTSNSTSDTEEVITTAEESDIISALKVEDDADTQNTLNELQEQLTSDESTTEEKNSVYEQIKNLNTNSGLEDAIEDAIKKEYSCDTFAKIEDTSVKVVVDNCDNSKTLANNIMRLVQEQFDSKMYISVQFES